MSCYIRARIKVIGKLLESRHFRSNRIELRGHWKDRPKPKSVASFLPSGIQRCQPEGVKGR